MNTALLYRIVWCLLAGWLLLITGCRQLIGGDKNILTPEIIKYSVATDKPQSPVKEVPTDQNQAAPADRSSQSSQQAPLPAPPVEEKLLPHQLNPRTPEGLSPLPLPLIEPIPPKSGLPQGAATERKEVVPTRAPDFIYRDQILTEDTAWHGEVRIEGGLTVAPQTTLTIDPGTVVRFRRGRDAGTLPVLVIQGRIQVNGSEERTILFTSSYEESLAGDWQGIVILASEKKNLIASARVEGAETGLDSLFSTIAVKNSRFVKCRTGLRVQDSLFAMNGGGVRDCSLGAGVTDSEADVRDAAFSGNRQGIVALRSSLSLVGMVMEGNASMGLETDECRLKVNGCRIAVNGSGLTLTASEGTVAASVITRNGEYGLFLGGSRIRVSGNEITANGGVGLLVDDGQGVAWGNALYANGTYDLYNAGTEEFRAIGNWWGEKGAADLAHRIYGSRQDATRGQVYYAPVLPARPKTGS